jgi:hypothetical protein
MFIVFDEVHHLPSRSYMKIAEMCVAPYLALLILQNLNNKKRKKGECKDIRIFRRIATNVHFGITIMLAMQLELGKK